MSGRFVMGIDIGSGACKITLFKIGRSFSATYAMEYETLYPKPGWAEQDSRQWINCAGLLINKALRENNISRKDIEAIALSGVTHSPVLLDKELNPLGNVIHITDSRSASQTEELKEYNELFLKLNFNPVGPMWTISMLKWIKENEPEKFKKIKVIVFPKDFVRLKLTGRAATDSIDAEGTLLFDTLNKKWSTDLTGIINLNHGCLPEILNPLDIAGKVTKEGSLLSGLMEGTPVVTGTTDTLLEIMAAGNLKKGECTVKLATFGRVCILSDKPVPYEGLINYSYIIPGLWYPGTGTKSCASSYKWLRDEFFKDYNKMTAFKKMDKDAGLINSGSEGLIFHPYLLGEGSPYNDSKLRGDFLGLTLHHKRENLARAVLEGTCFSLKDSIDFMEKKGLKAKGKYKIIGGGSKSSLWAGILADVLAKKCLIPASTDASYGAAMLAAVAINAYSSVEDAIKINEAYKQQIGFSIENHNKYKKLFKIYKKSKEILTNINHELCEFN